MELKDLLIEQLDSLGPLGSVRFSNSFGWICIYTGRNLFGGYKVIDNNILLLFLILSPKGYEESFEENFVKFDFGKTWAQIEIYGEDDLVRVLPFIKDAFEFSKERKAKASLPKHNPKRLHN
jgi:hypothetical protein